MHYGPSVQIEIAWQHSSVAHLQLLMWESKNDYANLHKSNLRAAMMPGILLAASSAACSLL